MEVREPTWSDCNSFRMYKIITRLKDNPDFEIQVFRRYSDLEWLIKTLQVEEPTCIIPPIPQKWIGIASNYYSNESPEIAERVSGIKRFLEYMVHHNLLCANKHLEVFLIGQDANFEQARAASVAKMSTHL